MIDYEPTGANASSDLPNQSMAIVLADATNQRLLEGVSLQLELTPLILSETEVIQTLDRIELLVADEPVARRLCEILAQRQARAEGINPALIVSIPSSINVAEFKSCEEAFEGVLTLPQPPSIVVAHLSVIVYAHRAYARRYRSAMEELNLNRRIFSSVTTGISISNVEEPDMPLVYVNPAFEVMTGYSLEEVVGKNCRFLQGDDSKQPGLAPVREALAAGRSNTSILRNYRKNGESFWNELHLSPVRNRHGSITHFIGIQSDVTVRVKFEEAFRQSQKLADVGRLSASIAHEINNPLGSIMNFVFLARGEKDDIQRNWFLDQIDKELQRVSLITHQSLRFYKQSINPQPARAADLVTAVLDVYATQLVMFSIRVVRRDRTCHPIVCLESEIRQVLNNLVCNAKDAMGGRTGILTVRTREATEWFSGAKGVIITVADNGCGMDDETFAKLYTAFYTTKGNLGTGLGMWISAEIISRHRGRMLVRTRQGSGRSGTVFQLFLPYNSTPQPSLPAASAVLSPDMYTESGESR